MSETTRIADIYRKFDQETRISNDMRWKLAFCILYDCSNKYLNNFIEGYIFIPLVVKKDTLWELFIYLLIVVKLLSIPK